MSHIAVSLLSADTAAVASAPKPCGNGQAGTPDAELLDHLAANGRPKDPLTYIRDLTVVLCRATRSGDRERMSALYNVIVDEQIERRFDFPLDRRREMGRGVKANMEAYARLDGVLDAENIRVTKDFIATYTR